MMTAVVALANVTLGSNVSTITFSSISQSYRDLFFVFNVKSVSSNDFVQYRVDGQSSMYGFNLLDGSSTTINTNTTYNTSFAQIDANYANINNNLFNSGLLYMADYSATDRRKNQFIKNTNQNGFQLVNNGARTPVNGAVNSIVFSLGNGGQFAVGSSIGLYGVTA